MTTRTGWRPAAVAVLLLAPLSACRDGTVTIAYRPDAGARHRYEVDVRSEAVTRLAGQSADATSQESRLEVDHRVLRSSAPATAVEVRVDPSSGPTRTFVVRFDRGAQLFEVERVDGLPAEVLGDLGPSELFPAAAGAPPDRPLAPGDRWTIDEPLRLAGLRATRLRGEGRLVALGVVDGHDVATVRSTYRLPVRRTVDDGGRRLLLEGVQETVTTATRDLADGAVREATARTRGTFTVTVLPPEGEPGTPVEGTLRVDVTSNTRRLGSG